MNIYFKIGILSLLYSAAYSMDSQQDIQNAHAAKAHYYLTINLDGQKHTLPMEQVLDHARNYYKIFQDGTDKISGLHLYEPTSVEPYAGGTVCKISDSMWIFTLDDYKAFHTGFLIYKGEVYPAKTFFPVGWSNQQIMDYIKGLSRASKIKYATNMVYNYNNGKKLKKIYTVTLGSSQPAPLRIIIEQDAKNNTRVTTLYPYLNSDISIDLLDTELQTLAMQQRQAYQNRLLDLTIAAFTFRRNQSTVEKPQ